MRCIFSVMAVRLAYENSCDVGVFAKLTNAYCLVGLGGAANFYRFETSRRGLTFFFFSLINSITHQSFADSVSENPQSCSSVFEAELSDTIPVVYSSIAGCRIVGRLTAANRHGLLVPNTTTDQARHS